MLHGHADTVVDYLGQAVGMHALPNEVNLVHVLLAKRLDRLPAQYGLLEAAVVCTCSVGPSLTATWLASSDLL